MMNGGMEGEEGMREGGREGGTDGRSEGRRDGERYKEGRREGGREPERSRVTTQLARQPKPNRWFNVGPTATYLVGPTLLCSLDTRWPNINRQP